MSFRFTLLMALALLVGFVGYVFFRIDQIEPTREHVEKEIKIPNSVWESDNYVPPSGITRGSPPPR